MFLARRDLWVARGRFALVGSVIALVALLTGLLSGLATGLVDDGISGLRRLPLTHLAFQEGAGPEFSRSHLDGSNLEPFADALGDRATPLGVSFFNATHAGGDTIDIAVFGTPDDSFLARDEEATHALEVDAGIVLSDALQEEGIEVGDELTIVGPDVTLPVLGFTYSGSYGHVDIAFTSLDTWQNLVYGSDHRDRFNAIALDADDPDELTDIAAASGTEIHTRTGAYDGSPGYSAESATMGLIRAFLIAISALIIGAFFTVWTVQRTDQIGLLKALGASDLYVIRDALGQLAIITTVAVTTGLLLSVLIGLTVGGGGTIPFRLEAGSLIGSGLLLIVAGLGGSLVALRRITSVDPAIALTSNT